MIQIKYSLISFGFMMMLILTSCRDEESCYDPEMEQNHSGICQQDCPQVCGCDGMTYCNECIAASKGIRVEYQGPCK